jgi:hypothetical protein
MPEHGPQFRRLKRRTSGAWTLLISGEWSQTPWHQGNHKFYIRCSKDNRFWALLSSGFPNRIVAMAHFPDGSHPEIAGAEMMRKVREQGGDYIDMVNEYGGIDSNAFFKAYFD